MKGDPLEKPPALLLPQKDHARNLQGRANSRSLARYDNYTGFIRRVQDMRLNMDTDETTTESENSSVRTRCSTMRGSSSDEPCSPFEDESSASDVTGSDHCPPYEEIPSSSRYSCTTVSSNTNGSFLNSFSCRDLKEQCSPVYNNEPLSRRSSSSSHLSSNEPIRVRLSSQYSQTSRTRPASVYSNTDDRPTYTNSDVLRRPSSLYSNCEPDYSNTRNDNFHSETAMTDVNENNAADRMDVSDAEKRQIEMFFRGLRTEIWVCSSLANMYVSKSGQEGSWTFKHTGVPLLLLESGDTKSRSKRRIHIILAEKGTAFPLWKDVIDNLSSYRKAGPAFHTMHLSSNHQEIIGLSFDSSEDAEKMLLTVERLTADPENIGICVPGAKKKKTKAKEKKLAPLPSKRQISAPCLFEHVTCVAAKDQPIYMSLKTLLARGMKQPENVA